jgi:hypothetical protein
MEEAEETVDVDSELDSNDGDGCGDLSTWYHPRQ